MNKISGVYKITNNITGDFYIGSSINIERRWKNHKCPSTWKKYYSQFCIYNGKKFTLRALYSRFYRAGIPYAAKEAKKYLIEENK